MKRTASKKRTPAANGRLEQPPAQDIYPVIDTDLARDNLENDMPAAERQELSPRRPDGR